jgi:hypothetical protein
MFADVLVLIIFGLMRCVSSYAEMAFFEKTAANGPRHPSG